MSVVSDPDAAQAAARLVERLAEARTPDQALAELAASVSALLSCHEVSVFQRDGGDGLELVAGTRIGNGDPLAIGDVRSRLWGVLMGRGAIGWDDPSGAPAAFGAHARHDRGIVARIPSLSGRPKLLVLGNPRAAGPDEVAAAALLAQVAAPALESLVLRQASVRTRRLLRLVTGLAATLPQAGDVRALLQALVTGVTAVDVIDAAVVWESGPDGAPLVMAGHRFSESVLGTVGRRRVTRMLQPRTNQTLDDVLGRPGPVADGSQLTLLPVDTPIRRVLGLLHQRDLDEEAADVLNILAGSIGPALRQAELTEERRTLVAAMGRVLRPTQPPPGCDIGVEHHPNTVSAESFGGDFYDWFTPDADRLLVALGDVSGKGIPAAASSSMAVWSLRALGRQGAAPGMIAHLLDTAVAQELAADRFVTLALADVDLATWHMRVVLAGHPAPIVLGTNDDVERAAADRPLGVLPSGPAFTTHHQKLEQGEAVLLFTDGITEAIGPLGERFGRDRLRRVARERWEAGVRDAGQLAAELWQAVLGWAGGPPDDDCAIIVLRRP